MRLLLLFSWALNSYFMISRETKWGAYATWGIVGIASAVLALGYFVYLVCDEFSKDKTR